MPRFLSPEWVAAFDAALDGVELPGPGDDAGLAASGGRFTVAQVVRDAPGGDVTLVLTVADGRLELSLGAGDDVGADVTIVLSYEDAAALARGELAAAEALTGGRVRVRGDLSVLVEGQRALAAAQAHVGTLTADTTY